MRRVKILYIIRCMAFLVGLFVFSLSGFCTDYGYGLLRRKYKPSIQHYVLTHMFDSAASYAHKIKDYKCDLYLKGHLHVHKSNRIIKYVPSMFKLKRGVKDYLYETISEYHYTAPDIYDRKIWAASSTFPMGESGTFDIIDYMRFNIYSPGVMEDRFLSPLSKKASIHYVYRVDSVVNRLDDKLYRISITPKYQSTQLIEGHMWASSSDWSIRAIDFKGKYALTTFHLVMQMGEDDDNRFLPKLIHLDINFKFMKNHLEMKYSGWLKYKSVEYMTLKEHETIHDKKDKCNLSSSYTLTTDTTALIMSRSVFNRYRPIPLKAHEDSLYYEADLYNSMKGLDTLSINRPRRKKNLVFWGQVGDALISSYNIDMSRMGKVHCSPLINPLLLSYSHSKGLAYRQEIKYNRLFHDGRLLRIAPRLGYNFTKKEFYGMADVEYVYNPMRNAAFDFKIGNGNRIYSSVVTDQLANMPDSLFSFDGLELDYFKDININFSHSFELVNGLKLWTGISAHVRYTKSTPEVEQRVRSHYNSFAPRCRVEWTPAMRYYINGNRKINVGSLYPTLIMDMEKGVKFFKNCGAYERFEMSVEQMIKLRNVRSLAYHIGGGFFTRQSDMFFVDFVDFSNTNLPQGWNDDIGGSFQMLDGRWYNSARHYFRCNATYETPFLLLYPVTKYLSMIQKERIYAGILFMPHLAPYFELGYGFGTHLFDAGVFIGNANGKFTSVGFKFTFELFSK